jgi:ketosteroid isomerase-like protein
MTAQSLRLSKEDVLRRVSIAAAVALVCGACSVFGGLGAPKVARLDEPAVRAFAASQEAAWNAHDFDRFYATVAPDAVFVSVRWNADGSITRETRTPQEDRAAAEHYFKTHPGKFTELADIDRIEIAADGLSAHVVGHQTARIEGSPKPSVLRATTEQTVILRGGRLLSLGQTDTAVR